jgi:hypothetical protein
MKLILRKALWLFLIIANCLIAQSQNNQLSIKTNYDIFDSLSTKYANDLYLQAVAGKYSEINFKITTTPSSDIVVREFANICIENDVNISSDSSKIITHNIVISRFDILYKIYKDCPDSLVREYILDSFISGENVKYQNYSKFQYTYRDTVSRADLPFIQSNSAQFVNAPIPERSKTFFEKVLEPAILVSAAILSVIILYTVRSN